MIRDYPRRLTASREQYRPQAYPALDSRSTRAVGQNSNHAFHPDHTASKIRSESITSPVLVILRQPKDKSAFKRHLPSTGVRPVAHSIRRRCYACKGPERGRSQFSAYRTRLRSDFLADGLMMVASGALRGWVCADGREPAPDGNASRRIEVEQRGRGASPRRDRLDDARIGRRPAEMCGPAILARREERNHFAGLRIPSLDGGPFQRVAAWTGQAQVQGLGGPMGDERDHMIDRKGRHLR